MGNCGGVKNTPQRSNSIRGNNQPQLPKNNTQNKNYYSGNSQRWNSPENPLKYSKNSTNMAYNSPYMQTTVKNYTNTSSKQQFKQLRNTTSPSPSPSPNPNTLNSTSYNPHNLNQNQNQNQYSQDPIKSRLPSRSIKTYIRQPTLKQLQQQKYMSNKDNSHIKIQFQPSGINKEQQQYKSIRSDSLQQSIMERNCNIHLFGYEHESNSITDNINNNGKNNHMNNKFKRNNNKYYSNNNNIFNQESKHLQQILQNSLQGNNNTLSSNTGTPVNINRKLFSQPIFDNNNNNNSPIYQYENTNQYYSRINQNVDNNNDNNSYLKYMKKQPSSLKLKDKKLSQILQLVQKDAQTPAYVRSLKKQHGEDIKMNNFGKFQPVGNFQWFSLGKYLEQIYEDNDNKDNYKDISKQKIKQKQTKLQESYKPMISLQTQNDQHQQILNKRDNNHFKMTQSKYVKAK